MPLPVPAFQRTTTAFSSDGFRTTRIEACPKHVFADRLTIRIETLVDGSGSTIAFWTTLEANAPCCFRECRALVILRYTIGLIMFCQRPVLHSTIVGGSKFAPLYHRLQPYMRRDVHHPGKTRSILTPITQTSLLYYYYYYHYTVAAERLCGSGEENPNVGQIQPLFDPIAP